jgi:hypothetical protein
VLAHVIARDSYFAHDNVLYVHRVPVVSARLVYRSSGSKMRLSHRCGYIIIYTKVGDCNVRATRREKRRACACRLPCGGADLVRARRPECSFHANHTSGTYDTAGTCDTAPGYLPDRKSFGDKTGLSSQSKQNIHIKINSYPAGPCSRAISVMFSTGCHPVHRQRACVTPTEAQVTSRISTFVFISRVNECRQCTRFERIICLKRDRFSYVAAGQS